MNLYGGRFIYPVTDNKLKHFVIRHLLFVTTETVKLLIKKSFSKSVTIRSFLPEEKLLDFTLCGFSITLTSKFKGELLCKFNYANVCMCVYV